MLTPEPVLMSSAGSPRRAMQGRRQDVVAIGPVLLQADNHEVSISAAALQLGQSLFMHGARVQAASLPSNATKAEGEQRALRFSDPCMNTNLTHFRRRWVAPADMSVSNPFRYDMTGPATSDE